MADWRYSQSHCIPEQESEKSLSINSRQSVSKMNQSPIKTILIPSLLTAGVVFGLSVTVVTNDNTLTSAATTQELALKEQYRNIAVRNIGLCILGGSLSGLLVAGGIRSIQNSQKKAKQKQDSISGLIAEFLSTHPESTRPE